MSEFRLGCYATMEIKLIRLLLLPVLTLNFADHIVMLATQMYFGDPS